MVHFPQLDGHFSAPTLAFTVNGNPFSIEVLKQLGQLGPRILTFDSMEEKRQYFEENKVDPRLCVSLFDQNTSRRFRPTCRGRKKLEVSVPAWASDTQWVVAIGSTVKPDGAARQLNADFFKNFHRNTEQKDGFPWGRPRKGETPPKPFSIPDSVLQTIQKLNEGPDLAATMADTKFAAELPEGSRISWLRVAPEPLQLNTDMLVQILIALEKFEELCNDLVQQDENVQRLLLSGVDLSPNSDVAKAYLFPKVKRFSVDRPDLHYTGEGIPFASEIDEMPGGLPDLVHLDHVYGINQDRWKTAFDWLCQEGPLVFLVSHQWSECYIPQTKWLVGHLQSLGYPVSILTTEQVDQIKVKEDGVYFGVFEEERIGTIWRQFPIFEVKGHLADIVMASYDGKVRMVPELAHFGNKAWFSVFRSHEAFYKSRMQPEVFDLLDKVLPHSYAIDAEHNPFPIIMPELEIPSLEALKNLSGEKRDWLVLKVCGANNLAARSYGVLMGMGIKQEDWVRWIEDRMNSGQPFVVQTRLQQGVGRIPVMNTKTGQSELFSCRVLARPWTINGKLVSVHGCAVPSQFYKVHGMVDMAVVPFTF
ncbi:MAG: hypothetical protein KBC12_01230 [Candidatus Pacebacteria bacterium]|nr:hypothetical protein [Candidatus Paceibacterota bacterium]MBP9851245.1 hypothetical protein [Candidatus Paceibacterota bacterium]